jgi:hypothetical protein
VEHHKAEHHVVDCHRLESDQKDMLISELKAENFELSNRHTHYNHLHDNISGIEHECAVVCEEKRSMESDIRRRSEQEGMHY